MKWKELTPEMLRDVARFVTDTADSMSRERQHKVSIFGYDVVAASRAVAAELRKQAKRRALRARIRRARLDARARHA